MSKDKFYITTPIYYVNDRMHLGHAYTTIAADVLARYHRLKGEKVFFLTGTDEHGGKIEQTAERLNKTPKQLCDENSQKFKKAWQGLNISYDNFIRTTDVSHKKAVAKVLKILHEKGLIYKGVYKGLYCLGCEQYKTQTDLVDGKCPDHKTEPQVMEEESYLFKLSKFGKEIENRIKKDEFKIRPEERKPEILEFLKKGLKDISISRKKVKWGIPLPFEPSLTAYVWVDAFLNYLTGLDWQGDPQKVSEFWPADVHLMAKDIFRVHATIWPALLLGLGLPLPKKLFIHGYFTIDGQKMSKSLGNVISPEQLIEKFGVDATRYLLLSSFSFGRDGDISWKKLEEKYDADLANGLGNLVSRILSLAESSGIKSEVLEIKEVKNTDFQKHIDKAQEKYKEALKEFKINDALASVWEVISFCDEYIEKNKLWKKSESQKTDILYLLYILGNIAELMGPFLPKTSDKILKQLGLKTTKQNWIFNIEKGEPLFPRLK